MAATQKQTILIVKAIIIEETNMNIRSLALCFIAMLGLGISGATFAQGKGISPELEGTLSGFYVKNNTREDYNLVLFSTHCIHWVKVNGQELKTAVALPKNSEASIELHIDQEGGSCAYEGSAIIIVSKTTKVFNDAVATLNLSGKLEPGTSSDYKQCEMRSKTYGNQKTTLDVEHITYSCKITLSKG
ncbi:hypothetical protein AYM02_08750 [Coxiella burnetii]|uniref:hypothetical protein n=1 Tax=Coxiella burnetii TaxID=777 RepID=UPI0003791850|nr:hypothetical protein [Coxiella burnetii]AML49376.1 hypothetical protein AUR58_09535 [Coxiella burnetii]AML55302.1 hypothetical protein AYM38_08640 [Coxiella burnetii]ATN69280.1 hypothetical protein AYM00_09090 [Coxiella burnetii]ATN71197.1 hypothetical protein AYM02_08750 [Coxiella burnetii]ATN73105.1 hypothetical protein AYM11_08500 [Coxiella burnetii]